VKLAHLTIVSCFLPAMLGAQSLDSLGQLGRTLLAFDIGLTGTHEASVDPSKITARGKGQVASLAVTHFVHREFAIEISGAVLDENDYVTAGRAHNEQVLPLLFGVNWAPTSLAVNAELRPFASFAAGPYFHTINDASAVTGVHSAVDETLIGERIGVGANWYLARHFALQLEGDYHAVPSFASVDGIRRNVSGLALSVGFGVAWGGP
jgi:hypothetical protein